MSGGRINIPSTIQDPAYRYTMPKMQLKQESRLNGVKTNITNLMDVANAVRVPEITIIKYFCAEVGSSHVQDSIITGSHTYEALLKLLDKFLAKYVLCGNCKYPEVAYEVQKKDVLAKCNACGHSKKLDTHHKAGRQLLKEVPTFYSANPEFRGKTGKAASQLSKMQEEQKVSKKSKKATAENAEDEAEELAQRVAKLEAEGGEINVLDAAQLKLDSEELEQEIKNFDKFMCEGDRTCDELLQEVRHAQLILNITTDYKYYLLFCGVFQGKRNCVQHWPKYEAAFLNLVKQDGELGIKRLMQVICFYFVKVAPQQQKYVTTFFRMLYDQSVFEDAFVIGWQQSTVKSDKRCILYDRKAEKAFRPLLEDYVKWLESAEYGDEGDYGEEGEAEESKEPQTAKVESEAARKQRELIEAQKKAQNAQLEEKKAQAEVAEQARVEEVARQMESGELVDATQVQVADEFDIDDI